MDFKIKPIDLSMREEIIAKIDNLTKPKGSLGRLEELALQICLIQHTLTPELKSPHNVLFAADHGIVEEGVTVSPKEVTWQQLSHFSKGGAGINFLCDQHGFKLVLVDAGVDYDVPAGHGIIDMKVRKGTSNFLHGPAMSEAEFDLCVERCQNSRRHSQYYRLQCDKLWRDGQRQHFSFRHVDASFHRNRASTVHRSRRRSVLRWRQS